MITTVIGTTLIAMLVLVSVTAVNGDLRVGRNDLAHKQAFEAAKAGIDDYAFHLHGNGNYWALCTGVPAPNAVNQQGSTTNRRPVPGNTGATYAIELIPAEGQSSCDPVHPTTTMIETGGVMKGTFRVRSTGFAENSKVSITATFKTASFLDYVYFTQLETSDPVTYGYPNPSTLLEGAYQQCTLTRQAGRYNQPIPTSEPDKYCNEIIFKGGDAINGPLHSNDALAICDSPTFGRTSLDVVEVSAVQSGSLKGWYSGSGCTGNPTFKGTYVTGAPVLVPPATNSELKNITEPSFRYTGQVQICLSGTSMVVAAIKNKACTEGILYSGPIPANGLVYVSNGTCSTPYSPFTATYPTTSGCGNVYVHGTYTGQLTIAAENDIVIDGSLCRGSCTEASGGGLLGLIANNFVRVFHAYTSETINSSYASVCGSGGTEEKLQSPTIDAAILSINHSFIVDHYDCGNSLGTLTIHGAISQKFRGPVGRGSSGYTKNYNYDDRLKYLEPPSFIEPEKLPWVIGRETIG